MYVEWSVDVGIRSFFLRCLGDSVVFEAVQIVKDVFLKTLMALESAM